MIEWEYKRVKPKNLYWVYRNEEWSCGDRDSTYIGAFWAYTEEQAIHFAKKATGEDVSWYEDTDYCMHYDAVLKQ